MRKPLLSTFALTLVALNAGLPAAAQVPPSAAPAPATVPSTTTPPTTTTPTTTTPTTTTPTTTTPTTTTPTTGAPGQRMGQPNFGQLMSSLNRMKAEVAAVQQLRMLSTNDVRLVKVQTVASGSDTATLNSALSKNASQLAALRGALSKLTLTASTDHHTLSFAEFLSDNKLTINQVVAADVNNGTLVAFIQ